MNPSNAAVFRLQRNHKDLTTDEYAENLKSYLDTARCCKNITMNDLNNILFGIVSSVTPSSTSASSSEYTHFVAGDHIAAFRFEHGKHKWFVGIIDTVVSDSIIKVSYLKLVDGNKIWTFPEEADIQETGVNQICKNIEINYLRSIRIKCKIHVRMWYQCCKKKLTSWIVTCKPYFMTHISLDTRYLFICSGHSFSLICYPF